jgi:NO-binding membrane sensor protein with MHYT domain
MISANAALPGSYDYGEVARLVFIAVAASYAGLDFAGRVTAAAGRARLVWLSGGAVAMGIGVWAMHLKGMLAFRLPVSVAYHWPKFWQYLLVAILASAVALYVASTRPIFWPLARSAARAWAMASFRDSAVTSIACAVSFRSWTTTVQALGARMANYQIRHLFH